MLHGLSKERIQHSQGSWNRWPMNTDSQLHKSSLVFSIKDPILKSSQLEQTSPGELDETGNRCLSPQDSPGNAVFPGETLLRLKVIVVVRAPAGRGWRVWTAHSPARSGLSSRKVPPSPSEWQLVIPAALIKSPVSAGVWPRPWLSLRQVACSGSQVFSHLRGPALHRFPSSCWYREPCCERACCQDQRPGSPLSSPGAPGSMQRAGLAQGWVPPPRSRSAFPLAGCLPASAAALRRPPRLEPRSPNSSL